MRALTQDRYGEPAQVLSLREVEQPTPAEHQALVRVKAASIHIGDCYVIRGVPYAMRPLFGLRKPRSLIPGMDLAGIVEQVGPAVTRFSLGDEVFGTGTGAFAEGGAAFLRGGAGDVVGDGGVETESKVGLDFVGGDMGTAQADFFLDGESGVEVEGGLLAALFESA